MTVFLYVAVLMAATWRISRLLADPLETGPWDILLHIRSWLGWRWDEFGNLYFETGGIRRQLAMATSCMKCSSLWIGLLFTIGHLVDPLATFIIGLPLALSGVTVIIEEALNG